MSRPVPTSASAGLAAFGPKIVAAMFLRRNFYAAAALDRDAWRAAAAMVALAGVARDAVHFSDLGLFLTLRVGNWIFLTIILIALLRWLFVVALVAPALRFLTTRIDLRAVATCLGMAHAPALLYAAPALFYAFGVGTAVTPAAFFTLAALLSVWMVAAFTVAIRAACGLRPVHALAVALAAHFALLLYNAGLDALLYALYLHGTPASLF